MQQMTLERLKQIAQQFTEDEYNIKLNIPIKLNNRLKTTLGRYRETKAGKPIAIDISSKLLKYADKRVAIGVVKHEAVHYALRQLNKPYNDGDHYFEKELRRLNLPSSVHKERSVLFVGEKYIFHCKQCHRQLMTSIKRVRNEVERYVSPCCRRELQYTETVICDGTDKGKCLFLNK